MYKWTRLVRAIRNRAFYGTLLFPFILPICRAVLVNRTIDSNFGDPTTGLLPVYQPIFGWENQSCISFCTVPVDRAKAFDGTWMAYTYLTGSDVNVTLRFPGVAVWVFFILAGGATDSRYVTWPLDTAVNITLDGNYAGNFSFDSMSNYSGVIYNATIFSKSSLANTLHELVIGTNGYVGWSYINFDWAIYTVDDSAPSSLNISSSTTTAFHSMANSPSITSTSLPTPIPQRSASKIGVIVGSTLGGLAVIVSVLVFLVRRLRRAPPVRPEKAMLDIDVPPHLQPFYESEISVPDREPTQSKAARLREQRQRELDERIQSAQHELDNLRPLRNAMSAGENDDSSATGPPQPSPELALLRNEMQQLRDRVDYLEGQRESDWALGLSNEAVPPAYT